MVINYFWNNDEYLRLAEIAIASAKLAMPGVTCVQRSVNGNKAAENADIVVRMPPQGSFVRDRLSAFMYGGEGVNLDVDTIILRDISHVFNEPFDLALTIREPSQQVPGIRYNWGVTFSRRSAGPFWLSAYVKLYDMMEYENANIERVMCDLVKPPLVVKELDGAKYNHVPEYYEKSWADDVCILHYKNHARKADMINKWSRLL